MHLEHILFPPPALPRYFYLCTRTTPCFLSLNKKSKKESKKTEIKTNKTNITKNRERKKKERGKTVQIEI